MELLLIRHAQSEHNTKASHSLDSDLTKFGLRQANDLADFLKTCDLDGFIGITSPYLRCLKTAEVIHCKTGLSFEVHGGVREYHINKTLPPLPEDGGMTLPNRIAEFPNFSWKSESKIFYANEILPEFVMRLGMFLERLQQLGSPCKKYLIVTHGAPVRVIHDVATGGDLEYLKDRYKDQELKCEPIENRGGIKNCSITHIVNGECKVFSGLPNENISKLDTNPRIERNS